ncbi:MAG TPA: UvrD-helicase domain-containing protein, partial [Myxococcota bacterium]|nr:UvrD-helicase domain-containing protein [Myxococcota bacterium]
PLLRQLHALDPVRLQSGRRVLAPLLREAQRRLRSRGIVSFSDLLMQTRDLLEQREDVRKVLRESMDQLLVDEFQDTDRIQCDIVRMLALEGALRPGLFLVGDPKQSIYGWRSADLAAYEDFVARVQQAGGDRYYLRVNFRSVPAILDEVERVCTPIMPPIPGVQPPFEPLVCSEEKRESIGFSEDPFAPVEHQVSWLWEEAPLSDIRAEDATALETRALARDLRRLHHQHRVPWNDIVLLMRSTTDVDDYAAALREAGIPYAVTRDRSYYQRREIMDVSSLLRCILDPLDHVALVATLRSPLCGVPDGALIPLWAQRLPELMSELHLEDPVRLEQIEQRVRAAVAMVPTDIPGIERVKGWEEATLATLRAIAALRGSYGHEAPDVWVERLRGSLALEATEAARYQGLWRLANLDRFLRLLLLALEEGSGDEQEVLRSMRRNVADEKEAAEGKPMDAAEDVVRVMTVHKSKGLDFAHVYLLQHHKGGNRSRRPEVDVAWTPQGVEYVLFGAGTLGYPAVEARKLQVESAERVRLLYVALTRAKERIVTMGAWPSIQPRAFQECKTVGELLANRPDIPELEELMRQAATANRSFADAGAARWRFPALEERDAPEHSPPAELPEALLPSLAEVAAAAARLSRAGAEATARMKLPWNPEPGSTAGPVPSGISPLLPPQRPEELWPLLCRQLRAILAEWRLEEPAEQELRRLRPLLERRLFREVEPEELTSSLRVTSVLLELFGQGPLPELLAPLEATRGLPLLWAGEGAAGYHSDQVDILYYEEGTWILGFWSFSDLPPRGQAPPPVRLQREQTEKALGQPVQLESWSVLTGEVHRFP